MFGYVTPLKPELKIREYEMFKSYYCGVCMHIKEYFGNIPRLTLNYDMAFLGVLLDALHNESPSINFKRCIAHPLNKKPMILNNKALEYAAAMNVSLVYYKFIDDVNDDKDIKSKMKILVLEPYKRKFNRNVTNINDIIEENLKLLSELEENKDFTSIDEIANPFSLIVAKILELYPQFNIVNSILGLISFIKSSYDLFSLLYKKLIGLNFFFSISSFKSSNASIK